MERTPQVLTCNEALKEATLFQNVGGKQMSRTFRFDKARRRTAAATLGHLDAALT